MGNLLVFFGKLLVCLGFFDVVGIFVGSFCWYVWDFLVFFGILCEVCWYFGEVLYLLVCLEFFGIFVGRFVGIL